MTDPITQRIARFRCRHRQKIGECRNRGYMLWRAAAGASVIWRNPGQIGPVGGGYRSLRKECWTSVAFSGRTILAIGNALSFVALEDIFWPAI
ncbi:hypothetical protein HLH26_13405 [Gluconacetobacter sp. 1b LMG 1731]|nr:hypothetical protein [Gluconacetobacter dulcium]MBB2165514.1 hypothetical protein [Gluconacetobacter dulcium]